MSANNDFNRELFERAFRARMGSCRRTCFCGVEYYENDARYSWNEGEFEALLNDPKAVSLPYSVSVLNIEGKEVVADCNCWVERAKQISQWLIANDDSIATFLNLRKKQAIACAKSLPEVN